MRGPAGHANLQGKPKETFEMKYNTAFFGLYQNLFLVLKKELGGKKALELFAKIMRKGLKTAYDSMGFEKGNPFDFRRVIKERDQSVGLTVSVKATKNRVVCRFFTDPFPLLKGTVSPKKLDATYMQFKVRYLLGKNWRYRTTKHLWSQEPFTEFVIQKIMDRKT